MWRFLTVACIGATALAACGGHSTKAAEPTDHLGKPKASVIEGLPVPQTASLVQRLGSTSAAYALPSQVTVAAASAWYDRELPQGQAWRNWKPCSGSGSGVVTFTKGLAHPQRIWSDSGSTLTLAVAEQSGSVRVLLGKVAGVGSGATVLC